MDLNARLAKHNAGEVTHTKKFRPWKIESYFAFEAKEKASRLMWCLKTFRPLLC
jgi:predicted GIY-YIG superfamily endonuclease